MNDISKIEQNKDALFMAEAGAYLHNLGKLTKHFILKKLKNNYDEFLYQHICGFLFQDSPKPPKIGINNVMGINSVRFGSISSIPKNSKYLTLTP